MMAQLDAIRERLAWLVEYMPTTDGLSNEWVSLELDRRYLVRQLHAERFLPFEEDIRDPFDLRDGPGDADD